jgi:rhodanese-related sulfurtransferase
LAAAADGYVRPVAQPVAKRAPSSVTSNEGEAAAVAADRGDFVTLQDTIALFESGAGFFVDARPKAQYLAGHIPGAFHIDVDAFRSGRPAALDYLPEDSEIIIYCGGGDCDASKIVMRMLESYGFTALSIFEAGFPVWEAADQPIEEGNPLGL